MGLPLNLKKAGRLVARDFCRSRGLEAWGTEACVPGAGPPRSCAGAGAMTSFEKGANVWYHHPQETWIPTVVLVGGSLKNRLKFGSGKCAISQPASQRS